MKATIRNFRIVQTERTGHVMADLFQVTVPTINEHLKNLYKEGGIQPDPTIRKFLIVRQEGARQVTREIDHYNLDVILSLVGVNKRHRLQRAGQSPD